MLVPALRGLVKGIRDGVGGDGKDRADARLVAAENAQAELGVVARRVGVRWGREAGGGVEILCGRGGVGLVVGDGGDGARAARAGLVPVAGFAGGGAAHVYSWDVVKGLFRGSGMSVVVGWYERWWDVWVELVRLFAGSWRAQAVRVGPC